MGIAWLFSIRLLCRRIELANCMAIVFIALNVCLICFSGSLNVCSICSIDGMCLVPLAPAVMTISGSTFQPFWMMSLISGWYFCILLLIVSCDGFWAYIVGQDPSDSKSNRLHVDIFGFCFIHLKRYVP